MTRPTPRTINTRIQNASAKGRALLQRWDRIGLGIRCAYNPAQAGVIRLWLTLGQQLVLHQALSDLQMQQRALTLLLRTAADEALPWFWRSVCLEHCAAPQARLRSLLALHDPLAVQAVDAAVRIARCELAATPPRQAQP